MNHSAYIYVMKKEENICKIGLSKFPQNRKVSLESFLKRRLKIEGFYLSDNCYFDEKKIHEILADSRIGGEFFSLSYEEVKERLKGIYEFQNFVRQIPEKVKMTFYMGKSYQKKFEDLYLKLRLQRKKSTMSELIMESIDDLVEKYKDEG